MPLCVYQIMAVVLSGMRLKAIFIFHFQLFKSPGKEQKAFLSGTLVVGGSLWPGGRPLLRVFFSEHAQGVCACLDPRPPGRDET